MTKLWKKSTIPGFTIIELVIVIIVITIISVVAVDRWPGTRINLNSVAQQLASDVRYTQSLAMSRAGEYSLNLGSSSYSITTGAGATVINPVTGNTSVTFSGTAITLPPTNLPNNLITFNSAGTPYIDSTATTALSSAAVITLTSGANSTTVTIQPQTGRVTIP